MSEGNVRTINLDELVGDTFAGIEIIVGVEARVGILTGDPEAGDPTLVIWDAEGESAFNLHLDEVMWHSRPSIDIAIRGAIS